MVVGGSTVAHSPVLEGAVQQLKTSVIFVYLGMVDWGRYVGRAKSSITSFCALTV